MCTVVKINVYRVDRFQNYVQIMQNDGNTRRHSMRVLSFESRNIYILCFSLGDGDFGLFFKRAQILTKIVLWLVFILRYNNLIDK